MVHTGVERVERPDPSGVCAGSEVGPTFLGMSPTVTMVTAAIEAVICATVGVSVFRQVRQRRRDAALVRALVA